MISLKEFLELHYSKILESPKYFFADKEDLDENFDKENERLNIFISYKELDKYNIDKTFLGIASKNKADYKIVTIADDFYILSFKNINTLERLYELKELIEKGMSLSLFGISFRKVKSGRFSYPFTTDELPEYYYDNETVAALDERFFKSVDSTKFKEPLSFRFYYEFFDLEFKYDFYNKLTSVLSETNFRSTNLPGLESMGFKKYIFFTFSLLDNLDQIEKLTADLQKETEVYPVAIEVLNQEKYITKKKKFDVKER